MGAKARLTAGLVGVLPWPAMNIPPDMNDPGYSPGPPGDFSLKKSSSKVPLLIGLIIVAVIGFFGYRSMQEHKSRELQAAVLNQFARVEKLDVVGKFWACLFGPGVEPGMFSNNLALSQRLELVFASDPKNFPEKVRMECTPKAIDAKHSVEAIPAPPAYQEAFAAYGKSLDALAKAFDDWSRVAPAHLAELEVGKKVAASGGAWHAFSGGKPGEDVAAYDRFLHCAVPDVDKMKDGQALVEYLFKQCKDTKYLDRLQNVCGKQILVEGVPQLVTPGFKKALGHLQADDRELSAFDDCLRKSRKGQRRDDSEAVGRAFVAFTQAGQKIRELGKEALASE